MTGYGPPPPPPPGQYGQDHPRATLSLILGILSLVLCQLLGPVAWVVGKRTVNEIDAAPGAYTGRGLAQAGYICGIVGTVLLGLGIIYVIVVFGVIGLAFQGHAAP
jgi:hypothetical protein